MHHFGCTECEASANLGITKTSTSTRMHHFGCPECEASANSLVANVDLNKDALLRMARMRSVCEFTNRKRRPQRGWTASDAQNARLLRIYESQPSTSTGMPHFGCPECEASANLGIANVDLQQGCTTSGAQNARLLQL